MRNIYKENLVRSVMKKSMSRDWESAVQEWRVFDCEEDEFCESTCLCGKEHIRYLYTIINAENGEKLYPIGSCCIRKFGQRQMSDEVLVTEEMFKLLHAIRDQEYITLTPDFFSRKLLKRLYDGGAFEDNQFNGFDGQRDYQFMVDMFNKRNKQEITLKQRRKINGIIAYSIRPYLERQLAGRIRN